MRGRLSDIVLAQNIIEIGKLVLLAEARLGELFNQMPKAKENQYTKSAISSCEEKANSEVEKPKPKMEVAAEMGFNKNQVAQFQKLADNPDAVRIKIALLVEEEIAQKAKERMEEGKNQYTSPEDKCPQPTPQEKNKIDRQNKTNYQLAKMAGVSHDTIAKVEKIEQQATPEIKAARAEKILRVRL